MSTFGSAAVLVVACVLLACQSKIGHPGEAVTLQGCLTHRNGSYALTEDSGSTYELMSQSLNLGQQVGHEILVRGAEVQSSSAPGAPVAANHGIPSIVEVTEVKSVTDRCSAAH